MNLNLEIALFYMWQFTYVTDLTLFICPRASYSQREHITNLTNETTYLLGKIKNYEALIKSGKLQYA